jgi:hypothetical protein
MYALGIQEGSIPLVRTQNLLAEPVFQEFHYVNGQPNFVPLKFVLKLPDCLGQAVVLGLMIHVIWILVGHHEVFFGLEVNLCVLNKVGKTLDDLLLPLPTNRGLV